MSAVVTGAGRGIGRAVAIALADRGHDIALFGRTKLDLEGTAHAVTERGRRALTIECDVSRTPAVQSAAAQTLRELGTPAVVINNAGVVRRVGVSAMTDEDWDLVVDVNLKGTFLVTRAFFPALVAQKHGRFIAMGSISSTLGTALHSAYCAAKWGVVGFTKSLAEELRGTGVQAMCVLPGSVDTDMLKGSGFAPQISPEDVARLVVYAALDAPDSMNGSAVEMFGP